MKKPYFLHDPDNGFEYFETEAKRNAAAKKLIREFIDCNEWSPHVREIFGGVITHTAQETNVVTRPENLDENEVDEDGQDWAGIDDSCDYELLPVVKS